MAVKLQNLHTHTVFGDGQNTAEEMVRAAIAAGCGSLGFSEHSRMPAAVASGWCMTEAEESAYQQEVLRLREAYAGQIDLFLGLERDLDALPSPEPYEYLIGSVHGVWRSGVYLPVDASQAEFCRAVRERYAGDYFAFIRDYYQLGGRVVTLGSDAHQAADLAADFDVAMDILTGVGFRYFAFYRQRQPVMLKLI